MGRGAGRWWDVALSFAVAQLDYVGQVAWALEERGCTASTAPIGRSGKDADRPQLAACLDYLRPGDTLVVPSLDRLSRSRAD